MSRVLKILLVLLTLAMSGCALNGYVPGGDGGVSYTGYTGFPAITVRSDILLTTPRCQLMARQEGFVAGMDCQKGYNDGVEDLKLRAEQLLRDEEWRSYQRAYDSVRWDNTRKEYVSRVDCFTESKYSVRQRCIDGIRDGQQKALYDELSRREGDRIGREGVGRMQVR